MPASTAGAGRSRSPPAQLPRRSRQRRPSGGDHAALDRGRALVLDQLLADRPRRAPRRAPAGGPRAATAAGAASGRSGGRRRSDAGTARRSSSTPSAKRIRVDPVLGGRACCCARAPNRTRRAPAGRSCTRTGCLAVVQQPLEHPPAAAQHAVHRRRAADRRNGPAGRHLPAQLDQLARRRLSDPCRRRRAGARRRAASACRRSAAAHRLGPATPRRALSCRAGPRPGLTSALERPAAAMHETQPRPRPPRSRRPRPPPPARPASTTARGARARAPRGAGLGAATRLAPV